VNTGVAVPEAALPPTQPGAAPAPVEPAPVAFQQFIAPPPPTPPADPGMVVPQAAVPAAPLPGVPSVPVSPASLPMTNETAQPVAQATPEPVAQPSSPPVPVPATAPTPAPRLPAPVAPQIIETAVFMVARDLPATRESAAAANEFLFSESKLPEAMQRFTAAARGAAVERLPAPLRQAVTRALEALAKATVSPEEDRLPEQLKTAVESLGLDHEARLASGEPLSGAKADASTAPAAAPAKTLPEASRPAQAPPLRESLKAAMLEVKRQADQAMPLVTQPVARAELITLRDTAHDIIQSVQAQQVGGVNAPHANSSLVYVQIPLVLGAELRGGDVQVSWGREKKSKKRDPRVPAQMTMQLETRALGTVDVSMKMLGNALSLIFRVFDTEVQTFIGKELPGLVDRLTGYKFRVDQAVCEVRAAAPAPAPARTVRATSSLDLKA
jgi:hypothetical protein